MSRSKLLAVLLVTLTATATANSDTVYPSTYPFDKESIVPTFPTESTPLDNKDYGTAKDPGGYLARQFKCDPYSDDRLAYTKGFENSINPAYLPTKPAGFKECRAQAFQQWNLKKNVGYTFSVNCTTNILRGTGATLKSSFWKTNMVDGTSVCKAGECCKHLDGIFVANGGRTLDYLDRMPAMKSAGGCSSFPPEEAWCNEAAHGTVCIEWFPKGKNNARINVVSCFDVYWRYLMSCPVFKASRTAIVESSTVMQTWEMQSYVEKQSAAQALALFTGVSNPDRVCHPYSYYHPEDTKNATGRNSSPPSGDSASGAPSGAIGFIPMILALSSLEGGK